MPEQPLLEREALATLPPEKKKGTTLPLITISGASGKTSTGWLIVRLLEHAGLEVAAWLSDGVYVDGEMRDDELHAWELAALATRAREIDTLIQEIPAVLASNVPDGAPWIAVLTSICGSDDQCQRDGVLKRDQLAVETITAAVRNDGRIVANADDLQIVEAATSSGRRITYYAMNGANPILRSHVAAGGDAAWIQNGWIKVQHNGERSRIAMTSELPGTLDGHLIFQVQNFLAAIATVLTISGNPTNLMTAISAVDHDQPVIHNGGLSIRQVGTGTIVADNPRSLAVIKQLARAVRAFGAKRVIHLMGRFDRMSRDDARDAGRILGALGGIAILSDGESSERMEALKSGLMNSDNPPVILVRQPDAVTDDYIASLLHDGDVAIVLGQSF